MNEWNGMEKGMERQLNLQDIGQCSMNTNLTEQKLFFLLVSRVQINVS